MNFELLLARTTLLAGLDGTGKSTIFDLLEHLRGFIGGDASVGEHFSPHSLTRWQSSNLQTFELTVAGGPDGITEDYQYLLELEHDRAHPRCRVRSETVQVSAGRVVDLLFRFHSGEVELFRDDGSAGPQFPFDWNRVLS